MILPGNFTRFFNLMKLPSLKRWVFNSLYFEIFGKLARVNTRFYLARGTTNLRNAFLLCHNLYLTNPFSFSSNHEPAFTAL